MKDKSNINAEKLESINSDLFRSFDPEDEMWLVGGSKTITDMMTVTPEGRVDWTVDFEWPWEDPAQAPVT